jgi:hypothetical protein
MKLVPNVKMWFCLNANIVLSSTYAVQFISLPSVWRKLTRMRCSINFFPGKADTVSLIENYLCHISAILFVTLS